MEEDELYEEPELPRQEEEIQPLMVWVNAGYGHRSYPCRINNDCTMTIPDPLVRELDLHPGDDLDFDFNVSDGILYINKKTKIWEAPDWLMD